MTTPTELKSSIFDAVYKETFAAKTKQKEAELLNRRIRVPHPEDWVHQGAKDAATNALNEAMDLAVTKGGVLPDQPINDPVEYSDWCSFYTNAGGMILEDTYGIPVSVAAAEANAAGSQNWVSVQFAGEVCVMTVEEAFDRGLREYSDIHKPTSQQRAVNHVLGNIVRHGRDALEEVRESRKKN